MVYSISGKGRARRRLIELKWFVGWLKGRRFKYKEGLYLWLIENINRGIESGSYS